MPTGDGVSKMFCGNAGCIYGILTIENIVVSVFFNFGAQACRYRGVCVSVFSLRRTTAKRGLHTPLRWRTARRLALLSIAKTLVCVDAGDAAAAGICDALGAAVPTATSAGSRAGQSTGCSGAHGRVLTLEALASPCFCKAEGFEVLFVFLLWWLAVFGPRHGLAGLVDVARPCFVGV